MPGSPTMPLTSSSSMTTSQTTELAITQDQRVKLERSLKRLDGLAHLMDDQFELPIIKTRIGLDPIIGLIPGGGDWVVWFVGIYIFWEAVRLGAPMHLLLRMASHIGVDLLGGYVPVVGDIFDVMYRSNKRNVELLRGHYGARPELGSPLPVTLPRRAIKSLERRGSVVRYGFAIGVSAALLAIASGPFLILYMLLHG